MKTINTLIVALTIVCIVLGTVATANKRRTALYGPQLPTWLLVKAWGPSDDELIRNMRDYVRDINGRDIAKGKP